MANATTQPTHRIHSDNEPLPGEGTNVDYSADNINRLADRDQDMYPGLQSSTTTAPQHNTHSPGSHIPTRTSDNHPQQGAEYPTGTHLGESRFDERAGLSGDYRDAASNDMPHAKPGIKDKVVGKTQELAGKIVHDPEMAVKGTIRSEVGKEGMFSHES